MSEKINENSKEWLVFKNGDQEYGIDILRVQELRGYEPDTVTRVAHAPSHVLGLYNLRGQIIPVIDLRIKLGMPQHEVAFTDQTVIVILTFSKAEGASDRMLGAVVDSVSDVLALPSSNIQNPPKSNDVGISNFLLGLATQEERLIQILDIEKMLNADRHDEYEV